MKLLPLFLLFFFILLTHAQRRTTAKPSTEQPETPKAISRGRGRSRFVSSPEYTQITQSSTPDSASRKTITSRKRVVENVDQKIQSRTTLSNNTLKQGVSSVKIGETAEKVIARPSNERKLTKTEPIVRKQFRTVNKNVKNTYEVQEVIDDDSFRRPTKTRVITETNFRAGSVDNRNQDSIDLPKLIEPPVPVGDSNILDDQPLDTTLKPELETSIDTLTEIEDVPKTIPVSSTLRPTEAPPRAKGARRRVTSRILEQQTTPAALPSRVRVRNRPTQAPNYYFQAVSTSVPSGSFRRRVDSLFSTIESRKGPSVYTADPTPAESRSRTGRKIELQPEKISLEIPTRNRRRTTTTTPKNVKSTTIRTYPSRGNKFRSREMPIIDEQKLEVLPLFEEEPKLVQTSRGANKAVIDIDIKNNDIDPTSSKERSRNKHNETNSKSRRRGSPVDFIETSATETKMKVTQSYEATPKVTVSVETRTESRKPKTEVKETVISEINEVTSRRKVPRKKVTVVKHGKPRTVPLSRGTKKSEIKLERKESSEEIGDSDNYPEAFKALIKAKKDKKESRASLSLSSSTTPPVIVTSALPSTTIFQVPARELNENDNDLKPKISTTTPRWNRSRFTQRIASESSTKRQFSRSTTTPSSRGTKFRNIPSRNNNSSLPKLERNVSFKPRKTEESGNEIRRSGRGRSTYTQPDSNLFSTKVPKYSTTTNKVNRGKYKSGSTTSAPKYIPTIPSVPYVPTVPTVTPPRVVVETSPYDQPDNDLGLQVISIDEPVYAISSANLVSDAYNSSSIANALPLVTGETTEKPVSIIERIINSITAISTTSPQPSDLTKSSSSTTETSSAILKLAPKKTRQIDKPDVTQQLTEKINTLTLTTENPTTLIEKILNSLNAIQATDNTGSAQVGTDFNTLSSFSTTPSPFVTKSSTNSRLAHSSTSINPLSILDEITSEEVLQKQTIGKLLDILNGLVSTPKISDNLVVVTPKTVQKAPTIYYNSFSTPFNSDTTEPVSIISTLSTIPTTLVSSSTDLLTSTESTIDISSSLAPTAIDISSSLAPTTTDSSFPLSTTTTDSSSPLSTTTTDSSSPLSTTTTDNSTPLSTTFTDISSSSAPTTIDTFSSSAPTISTTSNTPTVTTSSSTEPTTSSTILPIQETTNPFIKSNTEESLITSSSTTDVTTINTSPFNDVDISSTERVNIITLLSTLPTLQKFEVSPGSVSVYSANDISNSVTPEDNLSTTTINISGRLNSATTQSTTTDSESTTVDVTTVKTIDNSSGSMKSSVVNSRRVGKLLNIIQDPVQNNIDSSTPDYFIFAVLNNNTILRKRPMVEPRAYFVYGVFPNNTVVKKYPNGTIVPMETVLRVRGFDTRQNPPPLPEITSNQVTSEPGSYLDNKNVEMEQNTIPSIETNSLPSIESRFGTTDNLVSTVRNDPSTTKFITSSIPTSTESTVITSTIPGTSTITPDMVTVETSTIVSSTLGGNGNPTLPALSELLNGKTLEAFNEIVNSDNANSDSDTTQTPKNEKVPVTQADATTWSNTVSTTTQRLTTTTRIPQTTTTKVDFTTSDNILLSNRILEDQTTISTIPPTKPTRRFTSTPTTLTPTYFPTFLTTLFPNLFETTRSPKLSTQKPEVVRISAPPSVTETISAAASTTRSTTVLPSTTPTRTTRATTRTARITTTTPIPTTTIPLTTTPITTTILTTTTTSRPVTTTTRPTTTTTRPTTTTTMPTTTTTRPTTTTTRPTATTTRPTTTTTIPTTTTTSPTTTTTRRSTITTRPTITTTRPTTTTDLFTNLDQTATAAFTTKRNAAVTDLNTIAITTPKSIKLKDLSKEQKENLKMIAQLEKEQAALLQQLSFLTNLGLGGNRGTKPPVTGNRSGKSQSATLAERIVALAVERDKSVKTTTHSTTIQTTTIKQPNSIQDQLAALQTTKSSKQSTQLNEVLKQYNLNDIAIATTPSAGEFGKSDDALLASLLKEQGILPPTPRSLAGIFQETTIKPRGLPSPPPPGPIMRGLNWLLNALGPAPTPKPQTKRITPKPVKPKKPPIEQELLANSPTHVTPIVTVAPSRVANALSQDDIKKLIKQLEDIQKDPSKGSLDLSQYASIQNLLNTNEGVVVMTNGEHGTTSRQRTTTLPTTVQTRKPTERQSRKLSTEAPVVSVSNSIDDFDFESTTARTVRAPIGFRPVPGVDDDVSGDSNPLVRSNLITAAVNVTKAISSFLGTALQGAAASFQNMFGGISLGTRLLSNAAAGSSTGSSEG